jgi:Rrf2 family transcriptional regulator, nitric oxide-sensitive transcriptional repressor
MQLTLFSDYSLRLLLFLGVHRKVSVATAAKAYGVSQHHLVKVANQLVHLGWVVSVRGRSGGLCLAKPPAEINLGQVIRQTERFELVECFNPETNTCTLSPSCRLKGVLEEATARFIEVLEQYTLADMLTRPELMRRAWSKGVTLDI